MYDFLVKGGPVVIPIMVCSVVALGVFLERLWALQRGRIIPDAFIRRIDFHWSGPRVVEGIAANYTKI